MARKIFKYLGVPWIASFAIGVILSVAFGIAISTLIATAAKIVFGDSLILNFLSLRFIILGASLIFFWAGFTKVPTTHFSVITIFGRRFTAVYLDEGYWWTIPIPFIMDIERTFSKEEESEDLPPNEIFVRSDDDGLSTTSPEELGLVSTIVDSNMTWRIIDPVAFIEKERSIAVSVASVVEQEVRKSLSERTAMDILTKGVETDEIDTQVRKGVQELADSDNWGIEITRITISSILPKNAAIINAYERIMSERLDRAAETIEADHFITTVSKIIKELKMSPDAAARNFNIIQGKLKPEELGIRGGGRGRGNGAVIIDRESN